MNDYKYYGILVYKVVFIDRIRSNIDDFILYLFRVFLGFYGYFEIF